VKLSIYAVFCFLQRKDHTEKISDNMKELKNKLFRQGEMAIEKANKL